MRDAQAALWRAQGARARLAKLRLPRASDVDSLAAFFRPLSSEARVATVFSRVIAGDLPGRFVWKDPLAVAFLSISPLRTGHTLVVPRAEIDHWLDLPPDLAAHLFLVAQKVGRGIERAFPAKKIGFVIAGLEVPHAHLHLSGIDGAHDLDFDRQQPADGPSLDDAAKRIREALIALGHSEASA